MSLDDTLAAWAAAVRLPAATAADIYHRIVMTPALTRPAPAGTAPADTVSPGLDAAWWRQFAADFSARMIMSTRPVPYAA
jgi:transposase InsO family protein